MRRFLTWFLPLLVVLVGVVVFLGSCYDPNHPPPCTPASVDYPRCDPTQPPGPFLHAAHLDGGSDGAERQ